MTGSAGRVGSGSPGRSGWEHFDHGADIGVSGYGADLAEAFAQAALAVTGIVTDPSGVDPRIAVNIICVEPDSELLLVDWLNAVIYEMAARGLVFGRFDVTIDGGGELHARAWGEPVDVQRHQPAVEPKGATYTALEVIERKGRCSARCVIDV